MFFLASGTANSGAETYQPESQPHSPSTEHLPLRPTTPKKALKKEGNFFP